MGFKCVIHHATLCFYFSSCQLCCRGFGTGQNREVFSTNIYDVVQKGQGEWKDLTTTKFHIEREQKKIKHLVEF